MQQINISRIAALFALLLAFSQNTFAQATLSIQGIIRKSNGAAVDDGKYDLTFKLYATSSGGSPVHTETQNTDVAGGIYSTELGGGATPLTAAFDQTYYLGVSVDGGAELIPRARLTSSPYSLALLGTTNLFPSSGAIGAGTITPVAGYQLHVKNAAGNGKMLVEGTTAATIDLKKGSTAGSIGFGSASNDFVLNPGGNNTTLQYNGSTKMTVTSNGVDVSGTLTASNFSPANMAITSKLAVGQNAVDGNYNLKVAGTALVTNNLDVSGGLTVTGYNTLSAGNYAFFTLGNSNLNFNNAGNPANYSISTSSRIRVPEINCYSDRRIKKDFRLSDNTSDLSTLLKLRVTDYRHIDVVAKGTAFKKGFVAQDVEQIFPEAVSKSPDFIPDVYALSTQIALANGNMAISLEKNHGFAVGDEVKLILEKSEKTVSIVAVPAENTFVVSWNETAPEKVFVFGKKVSDFRSVDYDRLFTLNISATQELARQVEDLKKENAALKARNGALEASAEKFDARLRALENKLSN